MIAGRPSTRGTGAPARSRSALSRVALACALLPLLVGARAVGAEGVTFRAEVETTRVGVDDPFALTITIEGRSIDLKGEISTPELHNLQLVGGPNLSTRFSFVNGTISQSRQYTFVLQAQGVGAASIGPVRATFGSGERSTEAISIEVVAGSVAPARPQPANPFAVAAGDPFESMFGRQRQPAQHAKVFMRAAPSRDRVFVGEAVLVTFYLYTQAAVSGLELEGPPKFPAFWVEELPRSDEAPRGEGVQHEGETYQRFTVLERLLYPTKAGVQEIAPVRFRLGIPQRGGFFDPTPFGNSVITRGTEAVRITVDPLPVDPQLAGAVGILRATATIDRPVVQVGEAATLRFAIEGTGNLRWLDKAPELTVPGLRIYPPQVKLDLKTTTGGLKGSRTWEYVLIPETAGSHQIPPIPFAYLDLQTRRVAHTNTRPLELLAKAPVGTSVQAGPATAPAAVAPGELRLRAELEPRRPLVPRAVPVVISSIMAAAALGLMLLGGRSRGGAPVRDARTGAVHARSARKALADLRRVARGELSKEAAAITVEGCLAERFGDLEERPEEGDSEREREIKEILREARFIRFAPQLGDYSEKLVELAQRAAAAIRRWA